MMRNTHLTADMNLQLCSKTSHNNNNNPYFLEYYIIAIIVVFCTFGDNKY